MSDKSTGRDSDKFMLRLPDGMRDRIADAAKDNKRSMNAEIVARLEETFNSLRGLEDPEINRQAETFLKLAIQAARASVDSDRVFYLGSRRIGDDPKADEEMGITRADVMEAERKRRENDPDA